MKKFINIFLLHFQEVIQNKGRAFIYFLMILLNPLILILFWNGAISEDTNIASQWSKNEMITYYLLMTLAMSFLIVHIEEDVAFKDIKEGVLVKYLLRPFSYLISKFVEELPWRIAEGLFGVLVFFVVVLFFSISFSFVDSIGEILLTVLIVISALCISFIYKMILGLLANWTTDFWGVMSIQEVVFLIFGGMVMPLSMYPELLAKISYGLPFSYIAYFPVIAIQGNFTIYELLRIVLFQMFWIAALYKFYQFLWQKSLRIFTGVGQ